MGEKHPIDRKTQLSTKEQMIVAILILTIGVWAVYSQEIVMGIGLITGIAMVIVLYDLCYPIFWKIRQWFS